MKMKRRSFLYKHLILVKGHNIDVTMITTRANDLTVELL